PAASRRHRPGPAQSRSTAIIPSIDAPSPCPLLPARAGTGRNGRRRTRTPSSPTRSVPKPAVFARRPAARAGLQVVCSRRAWENRCSAELGVVKRYCSSEGDAMTEAEWLACKEPRLMLEFLRGDFVCKDTRLPSGEVTPAWEYANSEVNDRRLRLFTVVCCEILGCLFPKQRTVFKRIELCARMGEMPEHVVTTHAGALELAGTGSEDHESLKRRIAKLKQFTGQALAEYITRVPPTSRTGKELEATSLRDIFGNPFRPLPPRPEAIAPLAEQIY